MRVNTELVQTDVMVFDKKGLFVDGLRPEQFELKIDKKPQPIAFFERVASGSLREERRTQATAGASGANPATDPATTPSTMIRGRVLIFFIDDLHLSPGSLVRTRQALNEFIDHGMADKDQVAITSSSGQIGFLQQFTEDKVTLHSAVARLNYRTNTKLDMENPPMSEYIALKIREGDEQTIIYYTEQILIQNCSRAFGCTVSPQSARQQVLNRVSTTRDNGRPRYR